MWWWIMRVSWCSSHRLSLRNSFYFLRCVVAGRLANLDHNLQVLLIEAGESNLNNPWVYRPGKLLFPSFPVTLLTKNQVYIHET
jgi:hypothetical protein